MGQHPAAINYKKDKKILLRESYADSVCVDSTGAKMEASDMKKHLNAKNAIQKQAP